jgi:serine/threonine-protein kinase/endoribonuclease IRE1
LEGNFNISDQDNITQDLLAKMMHSDPAKRPTAIYVANHPFFWDCESKLQFMHDLSDRLDEEGNGSALESNFEAYLAPRLCFPWNKIIDSVFMANIERYRKYNYGSVKDLLRIVRNKRNHYHELPPEIKRVVGPLPEGYFSYFETKFPGLFVHLFNFAEEFLEADRLFQSYITKVPI